jgi:hypothetical protein
MGERMRLCAVADFLYAVSHEALRCKITKKFDAMNSPAIAYSLCYRQCCSLIKPI